MFFNRIVYYQFKTIKHVIEQNLAKYELVDNILINPYSQLYSTQKFNACT